MIISLIIGLIIGFIYGTLITSNIFLDKINNYQEKIISVMNDRKELMTEINELKYENNKHITM